MSLTRAQLEKIYRNAKHIHAQSRLPDVRRAAWEIGEAVEEVIGSQGGQPAYAWKD